MNAETRKALKGSIRKWEGIVAGTRLDEGTQNCPLCWKFQDVTSCPGCPVAERSDKPHCMDTPHDKWVEHHYIGHNSEACLPLGTYLSSCKECQKLAKMELDFLKSLQPSRKNGR
jgi:hypothetical protein